MPTQMPPEMQTLLAQLREWNAFEAANALSIQKWAKEQTNLHSYIKHLLEEQEVILWETHAGINGGSTTLVPASSFAWRMLSDLKNIEDYEKSIPVMEAAKEKLEAIKSLDITALEKWRQFERYVYHFQVIPEEERTLGHMALKIDVDLRHNSLKMALSDEYDDLLSRGELKKTLKERAKNAEKMAESFLNSDLNEGFSIAHAFKYIEERKDHYNNLLDSVKDELERAGNLQERIDARKKEIIPYILKLTTEEKSDRGSLVSREELDSTQDYITQLGFKLAINNVKNDDPKSTENDQVMVLDNNNNLLFTMNVKFVNDKITLGRT